MEIISLQKPISELRQEYKKLKDLAQEHYLLAMAAASDKHCDKTTVNRLKRRARELKFDALEVKARIKLREDFEKNFQTNFDEILCRH
jgi:hypothetical protein